MGEIENLLERIKAEYQSSENPPSSPKPAPSPPSTGIDKLLAEIKTDRLKSSLKPTKTEPVRDSPTELAEQEKKEALRRQQTEREKQRAEAMRQQRKRQALEKQAARWLESLDPKSTEGRWFEEFSHSHESKLEAAMIYLEALRETEA